MRVAVDGVHQQLVHVRLGEVDAGQEAGVLDVDPFRLLANEEFADNWANIWTTWLLTRSGNRVYHDQMNLWLEEQISKGTSHKEMVEKLLTATGDTNDNGAVNFILAHVGERVPDGKRAEEGQFEMVPITSRTTFTGLGVPSGTWIRNECWLSR